MERRAVCAEDGMKDIMKYRISLEEDVQYTRFHTHDVCMEDGMKDTCIEDVIEYRAVCVEDGIKYKTENRIIDKYRI